MPPHSSIPAFMRLARNAMATRFELLLYGENPVQLRALGEEALDEIDRIENLLSLYRPHTDIARINASPAGTPVRVSPETFQLLQRARELSHLTGGTFDPTAGALVRAWGFQEGRGSVPDPEVLTRARTCVGWRWVEFVEEDFQILISKEGVSLDLGAVGKGYSLDRASQILREGGVTSGLLQGGTSTIVALGSPPDSSSWKVALPRGTTVSEEYSPIELVDESLSVSAPSGKGFVDGAGRFLGHVIDPRTGHPAGDLEFSGVVAPTGLESDALSTALLVGGKTWADGLCGLQPKLRCWIG